MNSREDNAVSVSLLILRLGIVAYLVAFNLNILLFTIFPFMIKSPPLLLQVSGVTAAVCAALLLPGLFTRFAAAGLWVSLAIAAYLVRYPMAELALPYLIPCLFLTILGPGRFSLDAKIWPRLRTRRTGDETGDVQMA